MRLCLLAAVLAATAASAQAPPGGGVPLPDALRAGDVRLDFQARWDLLARPRHTAPASKGGAWQPAPSLAEAAAATRTAARGLGVGDASPGADTGYGYTWYDRSEQVALLAPAFSSIQGDGTELFLSDDESAIVSMGFAFGFPFYGAVYSQVTVCSNGYLSFTTTACNGFGDLGDPSLPNAVVAGYWTDLDPGAGGSVLTYDDVAPDGRSVFIAEWNEVPLSNPFPEAETYTFQIVLFEDGEIRLQYGPDFFDQVSGTIGLENASASQRLDIQDQYAQAGSGGSFGLNGLVVIQPPQGGGVAAGPYDGGTPLDFTYVTEPCGSQPSRVQPFVLFNRSGGPITVTPTVSGAPEFVVLTPSVTVPSGATRFAEVAFRGLPSSGGTPGAPALKTATLTLGGASPTPIALFGRTIETDASPHQRQAGGYDARSSVPGCNATPAPAAALLPFGPGTTDRALAIGFSTPDSLALAAPFRLYGEPYGQVYVNSSGALTFEAPDDPGRLLIDFPAPDSSAFVSPIAYGYFGFGAGGGPSPVPGTAYGGSRDVTGDGVPDLVVTFYRVRTFFGGYVTWQAILAPSATPGANGSLRFQYFAGTDPADGQPFASDYDAIIGINYQGLAGIAGDQSTLYHETRSRAFLAYNLFPATFDRVLGSVAVELAPHAERVVTVGPGPFRAGWRMLSPPGAGLTVAALAEQNLVQGLPDSYPVDAGGTPVGPNLFTAYDGQAGFVAPSGLGQALIPGRAVLWYLYDLDLLPDADPGRSQSVALPTALVAGGALGTAPLDATVAVPLTTTVDAEGRRFEMVGNPFEQPLDVSGMGAWATGGTLGSTVGQTYDPSTRSYVPTTVSGGVLPVWEGMFVEAGTATGLSVPRAATQPRPAGTASTVVAFELAGEGPDGATLDRAAVLAVHADADAGWDLLDASKLAVGGAHALVAFVGERDGATALKAQESRPSGAPFSVPLAVEAAGVAPMLTLSWPGVADLPPGWSLQLTDHVAGETIDLLETPSYTFAAASAPALAAPAGPPTPTALAARTAPRFTLDVTPGAVVAGGETAGVPTELAVRLLGAHPVRGTARLQADVPAAGPLTATVYDVTGRAVAQLHDGEVPAGRVALDWNSETVASGVYVVRVEAAGAARTRRLVVVR